MATQISLHKHASHYLITLYVVLFLSTPLLLRCRDVQVEAVTPPAEIDWNWNKERIESYLGTPLDDYTLDTTRYGDTYLYTAGVRRDLPQDVEDKINEVISPGVEGARIEEVYVWFCERDSGLICFGTIGTAKVPQGICELMQSLRVMYGDGQPLIGGDFAGAHEFIPVCAPPASAKHRWKAKDGSNLVAQYSVIQSSDMQNAVFLVRYYGPDYVSCTASELN